MSADITRSLAEHRLNKFYYERWQRDNRVEAPKVIAYLDGGVRPSDTEVPTHYGKGLLYAEDARRSLSAPGPPPSGQEVFKLGFESGLDGWSGEANPVSRPTSVGAEGGVVPVAGLRMGRFQVRPGEYAPWGSTMQASLAQLQVAPLCQLGSVVTMSGSLYIVPGFEWKSDHMHPVFAEHHGWAGMGQAPFHFGINTFTGDWYVDLHRQAAGYNPVLFRNLGQHEQGAFFDWRSLHDWRDDPNGRFKFWLKKRDGSPITDANLKVDWTGRTWNEAGVGVYPIAAVYRPAGPTYTDRSFGVGTVYHDDIRGTSIEPVTARLLAAFSGFRRERVVVFTPEPELTAAERRLWERIATEGR